MKVVARVSEYNEEFVYEEMTLMEFLEWAEETAEDIVECDSDCTVYIEYKDGTAVLYGYGDEPKNFRKTGITFGLIDNGSTYQVYGKYDVDENMIPHRA